MSFPNPKIRDQCLATCIYTQNSLAHPNNITIHIHFPPSMHEFQNPKGSHALNTIFLLQTTLHGWLQPILSFPKLSYSSKWYTFLIQGLPYLCLRRHHPRLPMPQTSGKNHVLNAFRLIGTTIHYVPWETWWLCWKVKTSKSSWK